MTGAETSPPTERPPPRRPTARPMQAGGCGALKCCPSCLEAKCCRSCWGTDRQKKIQGRERGGSAADFFPGPQASMELFGPTGDGTATKTNRTAQAGGGKRSPQVLPDCLGRRPVKNPGERTERKRCRFFFSWAPKRRRSRLVLPEEILRGHQDGAEALPIRRRGSSCIDDNAKEEDGASPR